MEYIKIDNNKIITGIYCGDTLPEGAIEVSYEFSGTVGDSVDYYNDDWTKKSYEELYKNNLITKDEYKSIKTMEISKQLKELDFLEIRPIASFINNTFTDTDQKKIADIEAEKNKLRNEIKSL